MGIWSLMVLVVTKLLGTFMHKSLDGNMHSLLLGKYLGVEWLVYVYHF